MTPVVKHAIDIAASDEDVRTRERHLGRIIDDIVAILDLKIVCTEIDGRHVYVVRGYQ